MRILLDPKKKGLLDKSDASKGSGKAKEVIKGKENSHEPHRLHEKKGDLRKFNQGTPLDDHTHRRLLAFIETMGDSP